MLRREKLFGAGPRQPLDRNAKARIMVAARAWSARHKQPGQHKGPITRAFVEVLQVLLWCFHNCQSGACYPSYEAIAARAGCARSTVAEALKVLEFAGLLTWQHRIARVRDRERDLFGRWVIRWRVIRTSNSYVFRDPKAQPQGVPASKSENRSGTLIKKITHTSTTSTPPSLPADPADLAALAAIRARRVGEIFANRPRPALLAAK